MRPEDWVNPFRSEQFCANWQENLIALTAVHAYEQGADAILPFAKAESRRELLEELKKGGLQIDTEGNLESMTDIDPGEWLEKAKGGWLVIIPEEAK